MWQLGWVRRPQPDARRETDFYGGSEFSGLSGDEQRQRIEDATTALVTCLGSTPMMFIPPYNTYDEHTVEALRETGFSLVSDSTHFQAEYSGEQGSGETTASSTSWRTS